MYFWLFILLKYQLNKMLKQELINELKVLSALRENRIRVSDLVLQSKANFLPLLEIVFDVNNKISIKAAWILEFVCKKEINWLFNHLSYFTKNIQHVHFDSAVRPISKICQLLMQKNNKAPILNFSNKHKEQITETCFDWMISNHKVATKAYTMQTLFLLGKQHDWIHEELKLIILKNIDFESSAYKSRGKITLKQIIKFRKKSN